MQSAFIKSPFFGQHFNICRHPPSNSYMKRNLGVDSQNLLHNSLHHARLAQSVEHQTFNLRVKGSSPLLGDTFFMQRDLNRCFSQFASHEASQCTPFHHYHPAEQRGAVEACWAHNPEVDGSKPSAASSFFFFLRHHSFQDTNRENYTVTRHPLIAQLVERRTVEA